MNTKLKTTKLPKKNAVKNKRKLPIIQLAHAKHPLLRHLRLIESKHTGKLIHHRHTSHFALVVVVVIAGVLLLIDQNFVGAQQLVSGSSVTVGLVVPSAPPKIGAKILSPISKSKIKNSTLDISGSCSTGLLVVVYDNAKVTGSTICTSQGIFSITTQLQVGDNALQAMNYDGINQAGPETPVVVVRVDDDLTLESVTPVVAYSVPAGKLQNPAIIPAITPSKGSCSNYSGEASVSVGGPLNVTVACIVRGLQPSEQSVIGLAINGGQPPYAINVNLGNDEVKDDTLISIPTPGYTVTPIVFNKPGQYTVKIRAMDKIGNTALTQTVVEVNGIVGLNTFASIKYAAFNTSWLQTPVPIYLMVLALTIGFWIGDFFDRHFGISKYHKLKRKTT